MLRGGTSSALAVAIALLAAPAVAAQDAAAPMTAQPSAAAPATAAAAAPSGAPIVRPRRHHAKGDPLEGFNRTMFSIHQFLDRIAFRPLSVVYKTIIPKPIRTGIRHIFSNVGEPLVFANDVLQLKPKRAIKTVGRFLVNSTIGIGGILDVAKTRDFRLPHHDNSFGNTLGHYGVGPGPYLFLPLVGPSTFRDFSAGIAQGQTYAFTIGTPFDRAEYRVSEAVLTGLDMRVESDDALKALLGGAIDPYATLRSAYLQDRAASVAETHGGAKGATVSPLDDPLSDPAADAGNTPAPSGAASPMSDPLTDPAVPAARPAAASPPPDAADSAPPVADDFPADPAAPAITAPAATSAPSPAKAGAQE